MLSSYILHLKPRHPFTIQCRSCMTTTFLSISSLMAFSHFIINKSSLLQGSLVTYTVPLVSESYTLPYIVPSASPLNPSAYMPPICNLLRRHLCQLLFAKTRRHRHLVLALPPFPHHPHHSHPINITCVHHPLPPQTLHIYTLIPIPSTPSARLSLCASIPSLTPPRKTTTRTTHREKRTTSLATALASLCAAPRHVTAHPAAHLAAFLAAMSQTTTLWTYPTEYICRPQFEQPNQPVHDCGVKDPRADKRADDNAGDGATGEMRGGRRGGWRRL